MFIQPPEKEYVKEYTEQDLQYFGQSELIELILKLQSKINS